MVSDLVAAAAARPRRWSRTSSGWPTRRARSCAGAPPRAPAGDLGRRAGPRDRRRDAADRPLAEADRLRRRAPPGGFPITAYDQLTAAQVKSRLGDLSPPELRKVRTYENNNQGRKGLLKDIDKRLK